ncbi:MAG TPA: hypothetical protein VI653_01095 [Steroidobacteraceae bacterium]
MRSRRDFYVLFRAPADGVTVKVMAGPLLTLTHARGAYARLKRRGLMAPAVVRYWPDRRRTDE